MRRTKNKHTFCNLILILKTNSNSLTSTLCFVGNGFRIFFFFYVIHYDFTLKKQKNKKPTLKDHEMKIIKIRFLHNI